MRLHPEEGSTLFVRVILHKTQADMRRTYKKEHGDDVGATAEGLCFEPFRTSRLVAEVHLSEEHLDGDTIAHELFHAAIAWGRRVKVDWKSVGDAKEWVSDHEERLAWVMGRMSGQLFDRLMEWGYGE